MIKRLFHLIFPKRCDLCNIIIQESEWICVACISDLPLTYYWLEKENPAFNILSEKIAIEQLVPFLFFNSHQKVSWLIYKLKYGGNPKLGFLIGRLMGNYLKDFLPKNSLLIPIPLHPKKEKSRGYNQSEYLAKGVEAIAGICVMNLLVRVVHTKTQTKLNKIKRWKNVKHAFKVNPKLNLKAFESVSYFILIDDVFTTGATVEACAKILKHHFPTVKIYILTVAIAN